MSVSKTNKRFSVEGLVSFLSDNRDRVKYTLNTICDYVAEKDLQEVVLAVTQKIPKRQRLNVLKAAKETWEELQEELVPEDGSNESSELSEEEEEEVSSKKRSSVDMEDNEEEEEDDDDDDDDVQPQARVVTVGQQKNKSKKGSGGGGGGGGSGKKKEYGLALKKARVDPEEGRDDEDDEDDEDQEQEHEKRKREKDLVAAALKAAEDSLEWWLVIGPYFEESLAGKTQFELLAELKEVTTTDLRVEEKENKEFMLLALGEHYRAQLLQKRTVVELRQRAGKSSGSKQELVSFLSKKFAAVALDYVAGREANFGSEDMSELYSFLSLIPMVSPNNQAQKELQINPGDRLKLLSGKATESVEMSRLACFSRDAHIAYVWNSLGGKNKDIVEQLNCWTEVSLSHETWCQRRRRGNLLLHYPVFAYQSVIKLDVRPGSLSPARLLGMMKSDLDFQECNSRLETRFVQILGLNHCQELEGSGHDGGGTPVQDAPPIIMDEYNNGEEEEEDDEDEAELHVHGYEVYKGLMCNAVNDDLIRVLDENSRRLGHLIFNNNNARGGDRDGDDDDDDNKRSQMEFYRVQSRRDAKHSAAFERELTFVMRDLFPNYKESGMVVLRSDPGCRAQRAHTDYTPTDQNGAAL